MAKIESRPAKREMGRYIFLVDLLGHRQDTALAEALEQNPVEAVNKAGTVYQILLQRALEQPTGEWEGDSDAICCWVCNSFNTRLVVAPGYGVAHECLDCSDRFPENGPVQWVD